MTKRFLITGCPRSGTKSAAFWFQSMGYDIQHEVMGKDGTADSTLAFDRQGYEFKTVFHLIRNPLDCIASLCDLTRSPQHLNLYGLSASKGVNRALFDAVKLWAFINATIEGVLLKCEELPFHENRHKGENHLSWRKLLEVNPYHGPICFKLARHWAYVPSDSQAPVGVPGPDPFPKGEL